MAGFSKVFGHFENMKVGKKARIKLFPDVVVGWHYRRYHRISFLRY